jgi:hypothetical protein
MRSFFTRALVLSLVLAWSATLAQAQAPPSKPPAATDPSANAALQYWQAFAQMPSLDQEQQKLLEDWGKVEDWYKQPLSPEAEKLVAAANTSLMYLHRGAQMPHCDWGLDYGDGISMLLPHLTKSRDLARLAALRARIELEKGHYKQARGDLAAIMGLARHVGRDPIMICLLVQYGLEGMVVDLVAPYVLDIKAPPDQAVAMFQALPKAATLEESIKSEKFHMARWIIKKLRDEEARQPGAGRALWLNLLEGPDVPDSVKQIELQKGIELMEKMLPVYDEMARLVVLPNDQFDAQYPAFKQKTKSENPLAGTLLPAIDQLRAKDQRSQARLAMLLAAVAVAAEGQDKLKEIKDPFGSGPFEYKALDQGFELRSKLLFEDKPVTLTVGQRKR